MIQLFLKPSKINQTKWEKAYNDIKLIVEGFPTKIIRLEAYFGYENKLDKIHFDLVVEENTPSEHISFWGDWMSYTGRGTLRFYKNWEKQLELESSGKEIKSSKSVFWFSDIPYKNDGDIPSANGILPFSAAYLDTEGAHYRLAIIAIGILLEDSFPEAVFLTVLWGEDIAAIEIVIEWLENHFKRPFKQPIYFDRKRLFESLKHDYEDDEALVCRMAHLYRKKHKTNMQFAIQNIGYHPTFSFYSKVLADTGFGTFGFSDILDPWIAVTQDLEATLELVSASKKWLLSDTEKEYGAKKAANYDLSYILKKLLHNYILWTPLQREELDFFYTNKKALEGQEEGLFEVMKRMMGYRINICPIYADEKELFESFMFYDPKNGHLYKQIIEDWKIKNLYKYEDLKEALAEIIEKQKLKLSKNDFEERDDSELEKEVLSQGDFVLNFAPHERYFVKKALKANPLFPQVNQAVLDFKNRVLSVINEPAEQTYKNQVKSLSKEANIKFIKSRIREIGYSVHPSFETWLDELEEEKILFYLHFTMALKVYDRDSHFARFRLLWDRNFWDKWGQ